MLKLCKFSMLAVPMMVLGLAAPALPAKSVPARKRIITFTDFERSSLYKELSFSRVKNVPGYRIYQDPNNNFVVAVQVNKKGIISAERILPIPRTPSKWQNAALAFFMIDFIYGDGAALEDMSASKEVSANVPQLPEGVKIRGFTLQQIQDPWKIRAGLEVRTSKARTWNLVFAEPVIREPKENNDQPAEVLAANTEPKPSASNVDARKNPAAIVTASKSAEASSEPEPTHNYVRDYTPPDYLSHVAERIRFKWLPASSNFTGTFSLNCTIAGDGTMTVNSSTANSEEDKGVQAISAAVLRSPPSNISKVIVTFSGDRVSVASAN